MASKKHTKKKSNTKKSNTKQKDDARKDPGPSVKDKRLYEALRNEGIKKQKAARIANAAAAPDSSREAVARTGGESPAYEKWTKADLLTKAREVGLVGRSTMTKDDLVLALRAG